MEDNEVLLVGTCHACDLEFDVWAQRENGRWLVERSRLRCPECLGPADDLHEKESLA